MDEEALKTRVRFENLITSLSSRFINLSPEEIDRELYSALKKIGDFVGVDRCYIGIAYANGMILDIAYIWAADGIRQYPQFYHNVVANEVYPWSARIVRNFEVLYIPSVGDLPPEAGKDKETLQAQQIKSVVVVPMVYKKSLIGIVGFDSVREKKAWTDDDIALLRIVGEIFSSAIERKWIEEELRESEERFRATFEQAAVGIGHVALDGHFIRVNKKYCEIVGYKCDELTGLTYQQITYPPDARLDEEVAAGLIEGRRPTYTVEKRYNRKDGSLVWVSMTVSLVRDREGHPKYYITVVNDITDRKLAEDALRESEERFRATFEQAAVGITHVGPDGRYIRVNEKFCDIVDYNCTELQKHTYKDITYPEDVPPAGRVHEQVVRGQDRYVFYRKAVRSQGWLSRLGQPDGVNGERHATACQNTSWDVVAGHHPAQAGRRGDEKGEGPRGAVPGPHGP